MLALSVSVAPNSFASSSFDGCVSMAMIRSAPASAAPFTADSPTPPQPITATVEPGSTFAALNTAPTPVITPQPTSAAPVQRDVGIDLHHRILVHQHLLAKRREVKKLVHVLAALPAHSLRDAGQHLDARVLAKIGVAGYALRAGAAKHREAGDDVVARLHVR